jgi:hypothetical protein
VEVRSARLVTQPSIVLLATGARSRNGTHAPVVAALGARHANVGHAAGAVRSADTAGGVVKAAPALGVDDGTPHLALARAMVSLAACVRAVEVETVAELPGVTPATAVWRGLGTERAIIAVAARAVVPAQVSNPAGTPGRTNSKPLGQDQAYCFHIGAAGSGAQLDADLVGGLVRFRCVLPRAALVGSSGRLPVRGHLEVGLEVVQQPRIDPSRRFEPRFECVFATRILALNSAENAGLTCTRVRAAGSGSWRK